ncbi:MAG: AAA family ATPase [Sandaracinus sp.]|nr:AAA family ATPase [Sandaracinus sp.]MCB9613480.1 AAA family ATPase [Sandaracinus sp.]MCB9623610.1 AAA family ATPase [Sandaracinus sp.]MCB9635339.1 AAA family ATPase [Sandaracinus sp.]
MTWEARDGMPRFTDFMNPCLEVLREQGPEMAIDALQGAVLNRMGVPEEVRAVAHQHRGTERGTECAYRFGWARSYLKKLGYIDNGAARGVWRITDRGRDVGLLDPAEVRRLVQSNVDADALVPTLPDALAEELLALMPAALEARRMPRPDQLAAQMARFRDRFGPDTLARVRGETLLELMHGRGGDRESLVYWLEFKNDEDFQTRLYGGIGGGTALKFGLYQSQETGLWMAGSPRYQRAISIEEAVATAESQRDQLVGACRLLAKQVPTQADYVALQGALLEAAPDVADTAWGHKYLSLLFPDLLVDFHNEDLQAYNLLRLLKVPRPGRYANTFYFEGIARQLDVPLKHLTATLLYRHEQPKEIWRVGTGTQGDDREWLRMTTEGYVGVGWNDVGSLSEIERNKGGRDRLRALVEAHYPHDQKSVVTKAARQLFDFALRVSPGDLVVAMRGKTALGIAEVVGEYEYEVDGRFAHRRPVRWLDTQEWQLPVTEGLRTAFVPLHKHHANQLAVYQRLEGEGGGGEGPGPVPPLPPLGGTSARIDAALERKGQVLLFGPPGTGKTYWATRTLEALAARRWFGVDYDDLDPAQRESLEANGVITLCTFHPAYGYEDFVAGYRPHVDKGHLVFRSELGLFAKLCQRAKAQPDEPFFLLIDEFNRGDVPRIFGELLTVLEKDKRGTRVQSPMMDAPFSVPENVFVVGTMNTADRSIALLDAALRRRFAFVELMPEPAVLGDANVNGLPLGPWLAVLNRRIVAHVGRDARNLQIGHSYLMLKGRPLQDVQRFVEVFRDDVLPLLQEYCYEDFEALERILGKALMDSSAKRFDDSLFEAGRTDDLFESISSAFPELSTTRTAARVAASREEIDEEESESADDENDVDGDA